MCFHGLVSALFLPEWWCDHSKMGSLLSACGLKKKKKAEGISRTNLIMPLLHLIMSYMYCMSKQLIWVMFLFYYFSVCRGEALAS